MHLSFSSKLKTWAILSEICRPVMSLRGPAKGDHDDVVAAVDHLLGGELELSDGVAPSVPELLDALEALVGPRERVALGGHPLDLGFM